MDTGFVWDEAKYQQVVKDHGVGFYEVVAAFADPAGFETVEEIEHEERWLWIGRTPWDRWLAVVFTEQDLPLYRIITADDAEGSWADAYYNR